MPISNRQLQIDGPAGGLRRLVDLDHLRLRRGVHGVERGLRLPREREGGAQARDRVGGLVEPRLGLTGLLLGDEDLDVAEAPAARRRCDRRGRSR